MGGKKSTLTKGAWVSTRFTLKKANSPLTSNGFKGLETEPWGVDREKSKQQAQKETRRAISKEKCPTKINPKVAFH